VRVCHLERIHEQHAVGDVAQLRPLSVRKGQVQQRPADHARCEFAELLQVQRSQSREEGGGGASIWCEHCELYAGRTHSVV
jgi:hypothetical protein